jgi:hypothetical protein
VCLVHFVVWVAIGGSLFVHTCRCCTDQFFSTQPFEDYFKVFAALITMTRTPASDWTPWYVDLDDGRMQCRICGDDFTKKNRTMLSHLGYIRSSGENLPPSYHDIRKRLLNETKHKIKAQIAERTKMFIRTYGATLAGHGWISVNNHPLLNMMYVSLASEEFFGAINTSGHMKDAVYIVDVIKRYLIEIGPENVVQVCTDNANVMHKAMSIVQQQWPHLYFQGCMAHALNLLLQDWGLPQWASSVIEDA